MKALTVHQPYATFLARGIKAYETRGWYTPHRGELAIHAGKSTESLETLQALYQRERVSGKALNDPSLDLMVKASRDLAGATGLTQYGELYPLGCVLGVVELVDCIATARLRRLTPLEWRLGDFEDGRFAWQVKVVEVFAEPVAWRGAQGLWDWSPPVSSSGAGITGRMLV